MRERRTQRTWNKEPPEPGTWNSEPGTHEASYDPHARRRSSDENDPTGPTPCDDINAARRCAVGERAEITGAADAGREAESVGAGAETAGWHTRPVGHLESADGLPPRSRPRHQGADPLPAVGEGAVRRTRPGPALARGAGRELSAAGRAEGAAGARTMAHRADAADHLLRPRSVQSLVAGIHRRAHVRRQ